MKYIDNEALVKMVEVNYGRWEIQTRRGYVIKGEIYVGTKTEAEDYIKRYLSSYLCWNYELIPMKERE